MIEGLLNRSAEAVPPPLALDSGELPRGASKRRWREGGALATSQLRRALLVATVVLAAALFAQSIRAVGKARILDGVARVGWGFAAILLVSGAREAARTFAWMRTIEPPLRLRFFHAFRARLAGEALNTLLPMGMLVGEPLKAAQVRLPFRVAFGALAVEFAFYCGSLVLLFGAGVVAVFAVGQARLTGFMPGLVLMGVVASAVTVGVALIRTRRQRAIVARRVADADGFLASLVARTSAGAKRVSDLLLGFAARHPENLGPILALETIFQVLAVAEVYLTLTFISPLRPTLASAVLLETISRLITMTFKVVPMRIGIDEAGASLFAGGLNLGAATGVTLALVRKLRLLFWSAVGLLVLIRRSPDVSGVAVRS